MAQESTPLTFERFWRWLTDHPNCVVRAGTAEATLFDDEDFHWDFFEDEEAHAIVHMIRGKNLVGEIVLEKTEVLLVQGSLDLEEAQRGFWIFELMGGTQEESLPLAYFVLSHGIEQTTGHQQLKH